MPLTIALQVVDTANGCQPLDRARRSTCGTAISDGTYSLYSQGVTNENYLRGVQATDGDGMVRFTSIFPACYSGRWPHIHFEVYPSVATATTASGKLATSQLALPEDVCDAVYATSGYSTSVRNLSQVSLASDMCSATAPVSRRPTVTGSSDRRVCGDLGGSRVTMRE